MIRFVLADLRRVWAGSITIVLLVALAAALGVAVTLQERALRLGSARAADRFDLVVGSAGSETQLVLSSVFLQPAPLPLVSGEVLNRLKQDPRVVWAAPVGFGDSYETYPIVGTTAERASELSDGRMFNGLRDAVAGSSVSLKLGDEIKPMHGTAESGGHVHTEFGYTIVGRMAPTGTSWDRAILVPIEAVWAIHGLHGEDAPEGHSAAFIPGLLTGSVSGKTPGVPAILVKPKTIADAYKLRAEYRTETTLAVFPGEVLTRLYATLGDVRQVLSWIAGASQILVAAAIGLTAITHVHQRRRQIGALRAFGAPRGAVFGIVWLELFLLMGSGIGFGFLIGWLGARFASSLFTAQSGIILPVEFHAADAALGGALLLVCALLASIPAWLAYLAPPATALRN